MSNPEEERELDRLLAGTPEEMGARAPSSLKARLYSALVAEQQITGPLATLDETLAAGFGICVFEKLVQIGTQQNPVIDSMRSAECIRFDMCSF